MGWHQPELSAKVDPNVVLALMTETRLFSTQFYAAFDFIFDIVTQLHEEPMG